MKEKKGCRKKTGWPSEEYLKALKESGFEKNPHRSISVSPNSKSSGLIGGLFRCDYCGMEGSYDDLVRVDCTCEYEVCKACGGLPFCKQDCPGEEKKIGVYVAGFGRDLQCVK